MIPISPTMSDFEGDSDEELPCVSLSQTTGVKSELEMPPASEVASLRAREEAAERALQDLRESSNDPLLISLSRSASQGSSGEEGEAALSAAVSKLQVTEQPGARDIKDQLQLLTAMRDNLPESVILNEYIRVVKDKPERAQSVTELILRNVSSSLISGRAPGDVGLCVCLLCAALRGPRGCRARRALHALLDARADVRALATAYSAAVEDAEQLLAAYDAVRNGARRGADQLASTLLAYAMARVLPTQDISPDTEPPAPLSSESVSLVRASWRKLSTRAQLAVLRCAGRALAAVHTGDKDDTGDNGDTGDVGDIEDMSGIDTVTPENIIKIEVTSPEDTEGTKAAESIKDSNEGTRVAEKEGGAALLAALNQPLPRASAYQIDRLLVSTYVSNLQHFFRSRFIPDSGNDILVETYFNCSQNSIESVDTPVKWDTPFKEETPIKQESNTLTPMKEEMLVKIPMKLVTPLRLDTPLKMPVKVDTPIKDSTMNNPFINDPTINEPSIKGPKGTPVKHNMKVGIKMDTPINGSTMNDTQVNGPKGTPVKGTVKAGTKMDTPINDSIMNDTQMNGPKGTPVKGTMKAGTKMDTPMNCRIVPVKGTLKAGTQLKMDDFFKQTPDKVDKDEERSPDRKRSRRERHERRWAQRSGKR